MHHVCWLVAVHNPAACSNPSSHAVDATCTQCCRCAGCRRQLEQCAAGCEVEIAVNTGCVLFKEGDYEGAAARFKEAAALGSANPVRPGESHLSTVQTQGNTCSCWECPAQMCCKGSAGWQGDTIVGGCCRRSCSTTLRCAATS